MEIKIDITEIELRRLVRELLVEKLGDVPLTEQDIIIEVKSNQNYKSEWEPAAFRARVHKCIA